MAKNMSIAQQLELACENRCVVKVFRSSIEQGASLGYVLDVGPEFFLLAYVGDDIRFDGFQAIRTDLVSEVQSQHANNKFVERALQLRGLEIPTHPGIDITSISMLIKSVSSDYPLIVLHREIVDPDVCHIGAFESIDDTEVGIIEINPDATWDEDEMPYKLTEITRIDFAGGYESALALVAEHAI